MEPRRRGAPPRWVALLLLLLCLAAPCGSQDGGTALQPRVETDTLLVALVDGSLAALDARSGAPCLHLNACFDGLTVDAPTLFVSPSSTNQGAFLWRFATREPLLSSSLTWTRGSAGDGGGGDVASTTAVFPGADGSLFAYQLATGTVEKLPFSAVDLVAASPSVSNDGAVVVGSRTSSAFALDPVTGAVLHAFTPTTAGGEEARPGDDLSDDVDVLLGGSPLGGKLADALLVGKTQYTVRSVDAATGLERWNVTYSELRPLRLSAPRGGDGKALPGGGVVGSEARPTLVPGTDASLRSLGPDGALSCVESEPLGGACPCSIISSLACNVRCVQAGSAGRCSWATPPSPCSGPAALTRLRRCRWTPAPPGWLAPPATATWLLLACTPTACSRCRRRR